MFGTTGLEVREKAADRKEREANAVFEIARDVAEGRMEIAETDDNASDTASAK